jgi:hypothetical protein
MMRSGILLPCIHHICFCSAILQLQNCRNRSKVARTDIKPTNVDHQKPSETPASLGQPCQGKRSLDVGCSAVDGYNCFKRPSHQKLRNRRSRCANFSRAWMQMRICLTEARSVFIIKLSRAVQHPPLLCQNYKSLQADCPSPLTVRS